MVSTPRLTTAWPAAGPRQLWSRSLGEGHSAFVFEAGRLFTMYRPATQKAGTGPVEERVIALDAKTGKTLWEHAYQESTEGIDYAQGAGPHSTPLIVGDQLFAMSSRVQLFALNKNTGEPLWSKDLIKEYGVRLDDQGYSTSPLAYRGLVIISAGAPKASVLAFNQRTGTLVWKGGGFPVGPGSPIVINVDGQDQLVVSGADAVVGMDPTKGTVLWSHPHKTSWGLNISTPVWAPGNRLFVSAAYENGARLLELSQASGKTSVKEQWFQNRMRVHIGTVVRVNDFVVGSSGDFGPCPTVAVDLGSGRVLWQSREFARAMFVRADDKVIVLDEDGNLGIAEVSPRGMKVLAKAQILTNRAWTAPTVVGTTAYVRDRKRAIALALGAESR
jgi:outer membrane protein assembly factor BamB